MDASLLREVRTLADAKGTSLSGLFREELKDLVRCRQAYDAARLRALARLQTGNDLRWTPPASRDELHER